MVKQVHHGSNLGICFMALTLQLAAIFEYHFYNTGIPKGPAHLAEFKGRLYFQPEIHRGV